MIQSHGMELIMLGLKLQNKEARTSPARLLLSLLLLNVIGTVDITYEPDGNPWCSHATFLANN